MKFEDLNLEDRLFFGSTYNTKKRKEADVELSKKFNVSKRTIQRWANKMGLTRESNKRVNSLTSNLPKILVFDLETAPLESYVWGLWEQNPGTNMMISDWYLLSWSAKWLFNKNCFGDVLTPAEAIIEDDRRIVKSLWDKIEEADIIIAHNANKFDVKKFNTRFLIHGLPHPAPYRVIDTLYHARKKFAFSSNKLNDLANFLGLGSKMETGGFELWRDSRKGNAISLKKMFEYNIQDVKLLEDVYLTMRPYIQPHPNVGLWIEDGIEACPTCGSHDLQIVGTYSTNSNLYDGIRCNSCGSVGRLRKGKIDSKDKRKTISPIPR